MKKNALPFVISSKPDKNIVRCCGCKSLVNSDSLRLGVQEYKTTSWFHYTCFWTKCYYRNHLRGINGNILSELVDGLNELGLSDRNKLVVDSTATTAEGRKVKPEAIFEGSEAGGDYELDPNTFDLGNLLCVAAIKIQSTVLVSIRKYFIPRGGLIAKPTKSGITLSSDQWLKLESYFDDVCDAISTTQKSIKDKEQEKRGQKDKNKIKQSETDSPDWILFSLSWKRRIGVYAIGEEVVVDIREFSEEKTFSESERGIRLTPDQWKRLQENAHNINASVRTI